MTTNPASQEPVDVKIEINQSAGLIRVVDPRIFRADRRGWCTTVAEAAASRQGVRTVRLNLETATCEIQFHSGPMAPAMAEVLAASLRVADQASTTPSGPRRSWFSRRSPRPRSGASSPPFPGPGKPPFALENAAQRAWPDRDRPCVLEWSQGRSITAGGRFADPRDRARFVPVRPPDAKARGPIRPAAV